MQTRGIGEAKACIILAAVEFGKRLELRFRALLDEDGTRQIELARA